MSFNNEIASLILNNENHLGPLALAIRGYEHPSLSLDSDLVVGTSSSSSLTGHWRAPQKYFPNYSINLLFGFEWESCFDGCRLAFLAT